MKRILLFMLLIVSIVLIAVPAYAESKVIPAPKNLAAEYIDYEKIEVSWDTVKEANRYIVYRREESETKWTKLGTVKTTTYTDSKAENGKTYYYRVRPYLYEKGSENIYGKYSKNGVKIVSKIPMPANLKATYVGFESISVTWKESAGANCYTVYRREDNTTTWKKLAIVLGTEYTDKKATNGKTYYYRVRPYLSREGTENVYGSYSKNGVKIVSKIPAPKNVKLTYRDFETVRVKWDAAAGANRYAVYRREDGAATWKKLATVKTTEYIDEKATDGKTYYYRVRPYLYRKGYANKWGYYKTSGEIASRIRMPKVVSAKLVGYQMIDVVWNASAGAEKYNVMRRAVGETGWTIVAEGIERLRYRDTTAKNGKKYTYTVRGTAAKNGKTHLGYYSGSGKKVAVEFVAPRNLAAENIAHNKIRLSWDAVENVTGYYIYRRTSAAGKWEKIGTTKKTTYTNTVTTGKTYYYTVAGYVKDGGKTVVGSKNADGIKLKAIPATPTVTKLPKEAVVVDLAWNESTGADGYHIYRKTNTGSWKMIARAAKPQHRDEKAEIGTQYSYRVRAYKTVDGKKVYSGYSNTVKQKRIAHVHFHQGDDAWGFSRSLEKKACVLSCFSMMLKNIGEDTNPKYVYAANGDDSGMEFDKAIAYYDREYECAVSKESKYFSGYDERWGWTYIKEPEKNAVAAIKEALDRNPEGVMCYFVKSSSRMHGILAIGYEGDTIYYSDPGRVYDRGHNVTFNNTWCKAGHNMSYKHLKLLQAID